MFIIILTPTTFDDIFRSRGMISLFRNCSHLHHSILCRILLYKRNVTLDTSVYPPSSARGDDSDKCIPGIYNTAAGYIIWIYFRVIFSWIFTTERVGGEHSAPNVSHEHYKKEILFRPREASSHTHTHTRILGNP